jgi:hypothetical protein
MDSHRHNIPFFSLRQSVVPSLFYSFIHLQILLRPFF